MTDGTGLGDRMKRHERVTRAVLPFPAYTICRVDIRAAHSLLKDADRPFDYAFMEAMDATAVALCSEITGAVAAFVQSDEISVLYADFGLDVQPWFGGVVAKQVSISAATATAAFCAQWPRRAVFDSRVFTVPTSVEAANYLRWRQQDAIRNSIAMTAQAVFTPEQLHRVNGDGMRAMLAGRGIAWEDYPAGARHGRLVSRQTRERKFEYKDRQSGLVVATEGLRSWWEAQPAPLFTATPDGFLAGLIPAMPTLHEAGSVAPAPAEVAIPVNGGR